MIKHLIIGGGIGGVLTAIYLQKKGGIPARNLRILDPHPTLLARWHANVEACGMRYLRSSSSHVLDSDFRSLRRFAASSKHFDEADFTPPYRRPSVRLFHAHTAHVMQMTNVPELHMKGSAQALSRNSQGALLVETDEGVLKAENVILSVGAGAQPLRPTWAESLSKVQHIYEPEFRCSLAQTKGAGRDKPHVVIVGGGIGAAQHACLLVRSYQARVTVVARHEPIMSVFDFNPCYVGPACLPEFQSIDDYGQRRSVLEQERYPGTMPPDVYAEIQMLRDSGSITWIRGEVTNVTQAHDEPGRGRLEKKPRHSLVQITPLQADAAHPDRMELRCDELRLATGFSPGFNRNPFMRHIASEFNAPCEADGVPVPSASLEWVNGVFLVGRAAELELGPPAGNIIGMHNAVKRLCGVSSG